MRKILKELFECQMTICFDELKLSSHKLMLAGCFEYELHTPEKTNNSRNNSRREILRLLEKLLNTRKAEFDYLAETLPKHVTQIIKALAFSEAKVLYKDVNTLLDWFFILFFSLLLQARVLTTPPIENQSNAPPLALGYDINTPPTAPPYAFNLVYYSLNTDLEGIYHERYERFETSRS